jgi:hypothetical protein
MTLNHTLVKEYSSELPQPHRSIVIDGKSPAWGGTRGIVSTEQLPPAFVFFYISLSDLL